MESPAVWKRVFGNLPVKDRHIRDIFTGVRGVGAHRRSAETREGSE